MVPLPRLRITPLLHTPSGARTQWWYGPTAGCNVNGVPGLIVYSRASGSPVQGVAQHITDAWNYQFYSPIGSVINGVPLHRTMNGILIAQNRSVKTSLCTAAYGPSSSHPGQQCDEYPFASSQEGGHSSGGNYHYFSVRLVPAPENESAGGYLVGMFNANLISEGEEFYVYIS